MSQEDSEFAPDKPEALPRLHVPGLQEDTASLPPEALAGQVPVLTEQVEVDPAAPTPAPSAEAAPASATRDANSPTVFSSGHEAQQAHLAAMAPVAPNRFAAAPPAEPSPKRLSAMAPVAPNRFAASPSAESAPEPIPALAPVAPNRFAASPPPEPPPVPAVDTPPPADAPEPLPPEAVAPVPVAAAAQEPAPQADTRREQVQSRIGQLAGKIHALHDRLNQIEKPEA